MQEWVTKTEEGLTIQYNKARRENETVYLQRIPDASTLPAVQAAAMVKSLPPEGLDPSKAEELFRGIVPDTRCVCVCLFVFVCVCERERGGVSEGCDGMLVWGGVGMDRVCRSMDRVFLYKLVCSQQHVDT